VTRLSLFLVVILTIGLSACAFVLPIDTGNTPASTTATSTSSSSSSSSNSDVTSIPAKTTRSKLGNPTSYVVFGKRYYVMDKAHGFVQRGLASWYGEKFHGRKTSSGDVYNMHAMTAAHKNLPLPSYVRVVNIKNGRSVVVLVNDRGPFIGDRIIDLSFAAATQLDIVDPGTAEVEISVLSSPDALQRPVVRTIPLLAKVPENAPLFIQLGSFGVELNAQNLMKELHNLNEPTAKVYKLTKAQTTLYRVRLGPLYDIDKANSVVARLKSKGFEESRVVVGE